MKTCFDVVIAHDLLLVIQRSTKHKNRLWEFSRIMKDKISRICSEIWSILIKMSPLSAAKQAPWRSIYIYERSVYIYAFEQESPALTEIKLLFKHYRNFVLLKNASWHSPTLDVQFSSVQFMFASRLIQNTWSGLQSQEATAAAVVKSLLLQIQANHNIVKKCNYR